MNLSAYNRFCKSLPHTAHVVQWGGAHVWKVGGARGKVFAVCWADEKDELLITFKASEASYDMLKSAPGLRPAPYFASRGMKWLQWFNNKTLDDAALKDYLCEAHRLAALGLTKKLRQELGLLA
jgi:predicted DNA-binding protein (MmcQ/YjbR family)